MAAGNATIAALKVSLGLDSAQFETGLRDASATMQREAKRQAQAAQELERRVNALKGSLDPLYREQMRIGGQMKEAQALYKAGGLAGAEYGRIMGSLAGQLKAVASGHTFLAKAQMDTVKSTRAVQQAGLGLSRQFTDIGVSLAGGMPLLTVLTQQLPQVADGMAVAKGQGVALNTVIKDMVGTVSRFLAAWAPVIAVGAAAAGAFLLWRKHIDDTREALKATAEATKNFAAVQATTQSALVSAAEFTEKYGVANKQLIASLDGVLASQNAAYKETLAGIDATDAAGRAAARRAEIERLLTVSILKRAAAEATARASEADAAAKKAKGPARTSGILVGIGLAGAPDALSVAAEAEAAKFKKLGGEAAQKAAAQEREYAKTLNATADALLKAKLIAPEAEKAVRNHASATGRATKNVKEHAAANDDLDRTLKSLLESLDTPMEKALREINAKTLILRAALDQGKISAEQFREAIDRLQPAVVDVADAQEAWRVALEKTPADIKPAISEVETLREVVDDLASAFDDVNFSFGGILNAFKTGNFGNLARDLLSLKDGLASLLSGGAGGVLTAGSAIANAIGGKGGRAIGGALGLAGAGIGFGALAGTTAGAGAIAAGTGLSAAAVASLGAVVPPLAVAAAALYAAAKLFNIGGKPTNAGAGVSLVTGEITGNKRTSETEQAALSAADAIKGFQEAFKAAGITLTETVHGLVIGTRDASQIYTTAGRTITAAVGDAGAAVEAGVRAILESAVYASDGQKAVAEKALAAGKSFDELINVLGAYEAAQSITGNLADQLQALKDPKAFDLAGVTRDIAAQRDAYKALVAEGYLTAEQLAVINGQLSELEQLRLDEVLKRYAEDIAAIEPVPEPEPPPAINDNSAETLASAAESAKGGLLEAYNAFVRVKEAEISQLRASAEGLKAFQRELRFGGAAGRSPVDQLEVLRREFGRLSGLGATDPERLANLQGVGSALIDASKSASRDELSFRRDQAAVRRATEASAIAAETAANLAQAELDIQTQQLTQLGVLTTVTADMATALKNYLAAQANAKAGGAKPAFDAAAYAGVNPDLARNWNSGGSLRGMGATFEEALLAHYLVAGQYEIAAGGRTRGFATGGQFKVGGPGGIDSQLMKFWASPGEMVSVSHGDPQNAMAQALSRMDQRLATLERADVQALGYQRRQEKLFTKWDRDGLPAERDIALGG